ncbi:MAG TPA: phage holin family protein [Actinomycetota bacterium]|nr:phage holin family protein [Actinomycetota bacterium]
MAEPPRAQDLYRGNGAGTEKSAGQLMKEVTEDLSTLIRKEVELVKQEVGQSVATKVKGAVVIAVAGVFAFFALIFLLLAIRDGFDEILVTWLADLATAGVLILFAVLAGLVAKKKLTAPISADMTKQTLKDDVEMVKSLGKR